MAVPPPRRAHVGSNATDKSRQRGRRGKAPSDDAASPRRFAMLIDKVQLRAILRARRRAFTGPPLPVPAAFHALLHPGVIVASYRPVGGEINPAPFDHAALAAGGILALPHVVNRATPLRFLLASQEPALEDGPFGLRNPPPHWPEVAPAIVLTPLVGFDRRGNRLGQGAGHYDRAFAAYPGARRIGVAWSVQEVDALPADPWDVPLHAIATEREWIEVA